MRPSPTPLPHPSCRSPHPVVQHNTPTPVPPAAPRPPLPVPARPPSPLRTSPLRIPHRPSATYSKLPSQATASNATSNRRRSPEASSSSTNVRTTRCRRRCATLASSTSPRWPTPMHASCRRPIRGFWSCRVQERGWACYASWCSAACGTEAAASAMAGATAPRRRAATAIAPSRAARAIRVRSSDFELHACAHHGAPLLPHR